MTSGADAELFLAVFRGDSNQVARALQNGANINARHQGLMAAARLVKATPLYAAVFDNKPEIVASLLALGADPTIPNEVGETPLQLAQRQKFTEIVQILTKEPEGPSLVGSSKTLSSAMSPAKTDETAQPSSSSSSSNREIEDDDEDEDDQDVSFLFPIRLQAGGPTES
jgi:hypothetical protein